MKGRALWWVRILEPQLRELYTETRYTYDKTNSLVYYDIVDDEINKWFQVTSRQKLVAQVDAASTSETTVKIFKVPHFVKTEFVKKDNFGKIILPATYDREERLKYLKNIQTKLRNPQKIKGLSTSGINFQRKLEVKNNLIAKFNVLTPEQILKDENRNKKWKNLTHDIIQLFALPINGIDNGYVKIKIKLTQLTKSRKGLLSRLDFKIRRQKTTFTKPKGKAGKSQISKSWENAENSLKGNQRNSENLKSLITGNNFEESIVTQIKEKLKKRYNSVTYFTNPLYIWQKNKQTKIQLKDTSFMEQAGKKFTEINYNNTRNQPQNTRNQPQNIAELKQCKELLTKISEEKRKPKGKGWRVKRLRKRPKSSKKLPRPPPSNNSAHGQLPRVIYLNTKGNPRSPLSNLNSDYIKNMLKKIKRYIHQIIIYHSKNSKIQSQTKYDQIKQFYIENINDTVQKQIFEHLVDDKELNLNTLLEQNGIKRKLAIMEKKFRTIVEVLNDLTNKDLNYFNNSCITRLLRSDAACKLREQIVKILHPNTNAS